jgi:hypothetical protein
LNSNLFQKAIEIANHIPSSDEDSGFALPNGTLALIQEIFRQCKIEQVFEFGSGQSTRVFLEAGASVYSLENDMRWLDETRKGLSEQLQRQWTARCESLQLVFDGLSPFFSWRLDSLAIDAICNADLVLIDSPAHPPSRELALLQTLRAGCKGIVIVDDLRIPTLERRIQSIAAGNSHVLYRHLRRDHGLALLQNSIPDTHSIKSNRSIIETIKTVRRYINAKKSI